MSPTCSFQVNSAKYDVDDSTLLLEVQQLGLPKENADALAGCFREAKDSMQVTFHDSHRPRTLRCCPRLHTLER